MKWQLLRDITQDIYRQFHYFTMVTSDQILKKDFSFFPWDREENIFSESSTPCPSLPGQSVHSGQNIYHTEWFAQ